MTVPSDPVALINTLVSFTSEEDWFEFKSNLSDPQEIGEYVSALSNAAILAEKQQAFIVFGIKDGTHEIVGTTTRLQTLKKGGELLANWLSRLLKPSIKLDFQSCKIEGKHLEILCINPAFQQPVKFKNVAYIRMDSVKTRLENQPERERELWLMTSRYSFEEGIAKANLGAEDLFAEFFCHELSLAIYKQDLTDQHIISNFLKSGLIVDDLQGGFNATNLLAIVAARNLNAHKSLTNKRPRVIVYAGSKRDHEQEDIEGQMGYVVAFPKLLNFIMRKIQGDEYFKHGIRQRNYAHPEIAVREFLANALIHQDLIASGYGPRIEIFSDKMVITNPGSPLVDTDRFIDAPARSRNEKLARLMRSAGLCEERGSGVDRACLEIEKFVQSTPLFQDVENSTVVTLHRTPNFTAMSKEDRVRACYHHAQLRYLDDNKPITNGSLRIRLGLSERQSASATGVINDAMEAGYIKPVDKDQAKKSSRYVPYYV